MAREMLDRAKLTLRAVHVVAKSTIPKRNVLQNTRCVEAANRKDSFKPIVLLNWRKSQPQWKLVWTQHAFLNTVDDDTNTSWMAQIKVNGQVTEFKLDTGAEVSAVTQATCQTLGINLSKPQRCSMDLYKLL